MSVNKANTSELELLRQRIRELEAENAEMPDLRRKISEFDAEKTELKHRIAEALKMTEEERTRRDAENAKHKARIEELESESGANGNDHEKPLVDTSLPEDKETDAFLDEMHKKKVSNEIRQRNWECQTDRKKLQTQESLLTHPEEKMLQEIKCPTSDPVIHDQKRVTGVSETACSEKVTYSIDEVSQHLAQLCDKAIDAEDRANQANQEEILCWCLYWKDFRDQLNEIIRSNSGKFGEKKIIDYGISLEKLSPEADHVTEIFETAH
ncbi:hypothetical protein GLOIN_2v1761214 [Rhizophagus irregularis DAOM 181602=DAOM 197198]|uniref:Uncharacterized protein n=1 Tax=Rhizophagus irregularis (strain DAOM 181602 / DAOM 197198 / MUCL 43194) TaxID=747089 RepID=A0A2P4QZU9_RHIID|nr:hypothetical protein GLOIN_2v1761214 [Rhizophagus irregularis DAOM 181602=DAOM 197198]POG83186.1 hypothetical protein GLOIN_2v1761214 [Rhizophagus irregularis DAOM 181602=DAOM 197198]|eukprot:XP_025190052.1 hypothetical protein GLOIN_2v1761214 [Rhizophagus irregularis DAOM 181602=DAOM 197198]